MNVPPFAPSAASFARDWMSETGAHELARRIRQAWAACGCTTVLTAVEKVADPNLRGHDYTLYRVTTNLIGGLPPRRAR